ncbi:MAG: hypothetical protein WCH34_10215 [Bacteroidota bacterium]
MFSIAFLLLASACSSKKSNDVVARVNNSTLYHSDIEGIVPQGTSSIDSILLIKNYIQSWIEESLFLQNAESMLSNSEMDFSKQLEDYKNSLISHKYEEKLINEKLDTIITDKQIEEYFSKNQDNFELRSNIVKVNFVKLMLNSPVKAKAKNLLIQSKSKQQKLTAEKFFKENAVNYFIDDNTWLLFDDILKEIPIVTYNKEEYLKNHPIIETSDSTFYYIVVIKDFKSKEGTSPLDFERDNIRQIILCKRKTDIINSFKKQIYKQAAEKNKIEIF